MSNKINKEAMIFGYLLGDGHLEKNNIASFAGDEEGLKEIVKDLKSLYPNPGKCNIKYRYTESPKYNIKGGCHSFSTNVLVGKRYKGLGLPVGNKVEQFFLLPDWIVNGSKKAQASFISGLYSAEGYIPNMQTNRKTIRVMGFNMHKRKYLDDKLDIYLGQYSKILNDLNIEHTINLKTIQTCDTNTCFEFYFNNNAENIKRVFKLLDLKYCPRKKERIKEYTPYLQLKERVVLTMSMANEESLLELNTPANIIAKKYGIKTRTIYKWRRRKSSVRLPTNFPTFEEFQNLKLSELTGKPLEIVLPNLFGNK